MHVKGSIPKEVQYINKLLLEFEDKGKIKNAFNRLKRSRRKGYSRSEIAEQLNHKNDSHAHEFINKLIENDALKEAGKRKTKSNQITVYKLDKAALRKAFVQTDFYRENRDLFVNVMDKEEDAFIWT